MSTYNNNCLLELRAICSVMGDKLLQVKSEPSVISHIEMMQGIISRMATCSMECKKWCIAIVSLLIGLFSNRFDWMACACAICVCLAFLFIDAGYLAMERNFRKLQNTFVEKMNRGEQIDMDVFVTKDSSRHDLCKVLKAMMSGYTCFVYLLLVCLLLVYKYNS